MSDDEQDYGYGSDNDNDNDNEFESQDYDDNIGELRAEVNAFDRIGGVGDLMITSDLLSQDSTDRFKLKVNGISRDLNNNRNVNLDDSDITNMLNKTEVIKKNGYNIEFINPSAYILGYIASNGGRGLDRRAIDNVLKNIIMLVDSVTPPDVIRYGRFWVNLNQR